jgi:predicted nucleotidyltransferase
MEVFGSGARGVDFDPRRSDVDFLVEFDTADGGPTLKTFFALRDALAALLGRPIDLVMAGSLANPFLKAEVDRTREPVYAA